jgi:hypothetical protein
LCHSVTESGNQFGQCLTGTRPHSQQIEIVKVDDSSLLTGRCVGQTGNLEQTIDTTN